MTNEEAWRIAIVGTLNGILVLLIQQAKAKLAAARKKRGCGLLYALGKKAGKLWSARYKRIQHALHRRRIKG